MTTTSLVQLTRRTPTTSEYTKEVVLLGPLPLRYIPTPLKVTERTMEHWQGELMKLLKVRYRNHTNGQYIHVEDTHIQIKCTSYDRLTPRCPLYYPYSWSLTPYIYIIPRSHPLNITRYKWDLATLPCNTHNLSWYTRYNHPSYMRYNLLDIHTTHVSLCPTDVEM